jgi:hypothetical protein
LGSYVRRPKGSVVFRQVFSALKIPRLPPLLLVLVLVILMLVLDRALPLFRVLHPPVAYLGAAPAALGVLIVLVSAGLFRFRKNHG